MKHTRRCVMLATAALLFACAGSVHTMAPQEEGWKPAKGPLTTPWTDKVSPENVWPEYPRPQMVRKDWLNLNGLWEFEVCRDMQAQVPIGRELEERILVPFPVQSALSGVRKPATRVWYRRFFEVPGDWSGRRVRINFGAVDWETHVWVNGKRVGTHKGGYDAFSFDITDALKRGRKNELVVDVTDPTSRGTQPRGKQIDNPHGIWYTPTTGIWQTVWLEPVSRTSIASLKLVPDIDKGELRLTVSCEGEDRGCTVSAEALDGGRKVASAGGRPGAAIALRIPDAKLWSPDSPHLYGLKVELKRGAAVDEVESYFGMRKIALGKDERGITRMMLNNRFLFQFGWLDQGFWPDGLYTAPCDEALRYDIEVAKKLGMNLARKHVKIEPARWYYWCDKLGLLVWQDMPSGDRYLGRDDKEQHRPRTKESAEQFEKELRAMVEGFGNHPSIVVWVPFNEGWGQYDTKRISDWVKELDPSRLVINASGWVDMGCGDINDVHGYPGPFAPAREEKRAIVLGEYGGLGLPLEGHTWQAKQNWGYRTFKTKEELNENYVKLQKRLRWLIAEPGLSAAIYTQTSDVEIEVNGLMTYDRKVLKVDAERIAAENRKLYEPLPETRELVPTAEKEDIHWRYIFGVPAGEWFKPEYNDSRWQTGPAGFGERDYPGMVVGTKWDRTEIHMRREFKLPDREFGELLFRVSRDRKTEIYLNGVLALDLDRHSLAYELVPIRPEAVAALRTGRNLIAVHCTHTKEGLHFIDIGITEVVKK